VVRERVFEEAQGKSNGFRGFLGGKQFGPAAFACLIWVAVILSWSLLQQEDASPRLEECIREAVPEAKWYFS
jgi:hypothetical protein